MSLAPRLECDNSSALLANTRLPSIPAERIRSRSPLRPGHHHIDPPQREQSSRSRQSSPEVLAPYRIALSAAEVFQGSVICNWQRGDILIGRLQEDVG